MAFIEPMHRNKPNITYLLTPLEICREKLALQYILKLKANPGNPAYDVVFNPKYQILYADKESARDSFGIHCKKLLRKAKIDVGEIAINSIPDVPIYNSEPVTVEFTLSEFDKSSASSTGGSFCSTSLISRCCFSPQHN